MKFHNNCYRKEKKTLLLKPKLLKKYRYAQLV
jgi:hypothetical protein